MRILILSASASALILASGAFLFYDYSSQRRIVEDRLRVLTDILAPQAAAAITHQDRRAASDLLARLSTAPMVVGAAIFTEDAALARYLRADAPEEAVVRTPGPDGLGSQQGDLVLFRPLNADGRRLGTIYLRMDLSGAADRLRLHGVIVGLTVIVLVGVSYILSARMVGTISAPLAALSELVKSVTTRRDYSLRAIRKGPDELGDLIEGINDMLSQIQVRDGALTLARNELENRVQERTAEITFVNKELSSEISERKRAEASLRESEERYRQLVEFSPDGILILGGERILFVNGAALRMLAARSRESLVGSDFLERVAPEFRELIRGRLLQVAREHRGSPALEQGLIRLDGSILDAEIQETPFIYQGQPSIQVVLRDISKRKEIERMKDEFVSTVSHELRTPLTSIQGSLGLVANGVTGVLPVAAKPMIDIAYKNCSRLILLINDILDSEKIAAGKMKFALKEQELMPLLEHAIDANRAFGAQFHVRFELGETAPGARVVVDTDRMIQVLTNLLSNAAKFSPRGDVVTVSTRRQEGRIRLSVTDRGAGISPEFRERIFQKFSQADSSDRRSKGGTGLGLSISKAIVENHEGTLSFVSEAGKGTTFTVDLPDKSSSPAGAVPPSGPRVLICDDEPRVADLLKLVLEREGFQTSVVHSLRDAREGLEAGGIDLLVVDLLLPDGNGLHLLQELRKSPAHASLPALLVSSLARSAQELGGDALGGVEFLEKPLDLERLAAAARAAVRNRSLALEGAKP